MAKEIKLPEKTVVPSNWSWTEMGKLVQTKTGYPFDSKRFSDGRKGGRPLVRIRDVLRGNTETFTDEVCSEEYTVHFGDILIGMDGDFNTAKWRSGDSLLNQRVCRIKSAGGLLLNDFLYYYLPIPLKRINEITPSVTVKHLSTKTLDNLPLPLPPIQEQHRIVARIESLFAKLDEAKEKAQAVVDGFELRKSAILHKAFTGELTERWRKERGVGLDSWEEICFGDLILSGPQNGLYKPKDVYGSGIKILRIDGFYDGNVEDWETLKRLTLSDVEIKLYELHLDEIVINRVNSMPYLGKSALIRELPETCVFESNMMRISLNKERVIPEFH